MKTIVMMFSFVSVLLVGCQSSHTEEKQADVANSDVVGPYKVAMIDTEGDVAGHARFTQTTEDRVSIKLSLNYIEKGVHGIHLHEVGRCTPGDFASAGGHYNPDNTHHGFDHEEGPHAGDLPNLKVEESGAFETTIVADDVNLNVNGHHPLLRGDGTSLVIHKGADDYISAPSGQSGARIMCGALNQKDF